MKMQVLDADSHNWTSNAFSRGLLAGYNEINSMEMNY